MKYLATLVVDAHDVTGSGEFVDEYARAEFIDGEVRKARLAGRPWCIRFCDVSNSGDAGEWYVHDSSSDYSADDAEVVSDYIRIARNALRDGHREVVVSLRDFAPLFLGHDFDGSAVVPGCSVLSLSEYLGAWGVDDAPAAPESTGVVAPTIEW